MVNYMNENKSGFTLVELVIVIVLIGILAATALPRFVNLTVQARNASNQGVAGALGSAIGIAHAAWIASGATGATINLDGALVNVNTNGWPDGGVTNSSPLDPTKCAAVWNSVLSNPPFVSTTDPCPANNTNCYIAKVNNTSPGCIFSLGADPLITITYNPSTGAVSSTSH